jgi:ribosomal protein S3
MRRALAIFAISVLVSACGSTSQIRQPVEPLSAATAVFSVEKPVNAVPKDSDQPPEHFLNAITSYLKRDLEKNGRLAKEGQDALKIDIKVTEFRMRSGVSRMMFGILAGKDGIASEVSVRDSAQKVVGSATVSTFNVMAVGGEEDIARMHAEEIAKALLERLKARQEQGR